MLTQLNPPIPMRTPKGPAIALFVIDYGIEHNLHWVCFQDQTGECWTWQNPQVRAVKNITQGREHISPFYNPDDVALKRHNEKPDIDYKKLSEELERVVEVYSEHFNKMKEKLRKEKELYNHMHAQWKEAKQSLDECKEKIKKYEEKAND